MKSNKGFTLVEVLVVIAIIGILALLILPNFISNYNNTRDNAMTIQENEVVDAAKLFVEDYCKHPLEENEDKCSIYSLPTSNTNKKYTCLNILQGSKYIDDIIQQGQTCVGFVIYNNNYSVYKSYIKCGQGYQTKEIENQKDSNGLSLLELCGG